MADPSEHSLVIQRCIERLIDGDESARDELLTCACDRLMLLTRRIKKDFPQLQRWEQTEDILQNASLRLYQSLKKVDLSDARHFFRLAALQIRRELIDMARHYQGPQGMGAHHATQIRNTEEQSGRPAMFDPAEMTVDPSKVAEWAEFHQTIDKLEEEQREVVDLLWYHGMSQEEAARVLKVNVRTVKRRWRAARLQLFELCGGELPGE